MPKYNMRDLPRAPPFQEFKQQLKAKYNAAVSADGTITQEKWDAAVKQAANVVTKDYTAAVKQKYLFAKVKRLYDESGVDFRPVSPPQTKEEFKSRLASLEGYLQHHGLGQDYMKNYEELNKLHLLAVAKKKGVAEPAVTELETLSAPGVEVEEKDPSPLAVAPKVGGLKAMEALRLKIKGRLSDKERAYVALRSDYRKRVSDQMRGQSQAIVERLVRAGSPLSPEIVRDMLSLRTGLDFSNVDMSKSTLGSFAEEIGRSLQDLPMSEKFKGKYKYLGAYRGSLEALQRGDAPINQLDALAAIHDLAYLEASATASPEIAKHIINRADADFIQGVESLGYSEQDTDVLHDAKIAGSAIAKKQRFEGVFGQFDLSTAGVKPLTEDELYAKAVKVLPELKKSVDAVKDEDVRNDLIYQLQDIEALEVPEELAKTAKRVESKKAGAQASTLGGVSVPLFPPQAPAPLEPGQAAVQSEVETTGAPGGIEKKAMGLEDVLKSLAKMNASTNPLSITPVTGERNLRPLLVRGDTSGDVVKRTPKEIEDNRNYYAAWKWVQEGAGNGNQQPLPDQVGMPANNRIWDMQKRNEQFKYMDNYDGGAKDWYQHKKATFGKYVRTVPVVKKKYVIPMYSDNQHHQWPTRNGCVPAGVGQVIKMARDKADGFEIFSPAQVLMAKQTRLFHGDVVESEGRLTRV